MVASLSLLISRKGAAPPKGGVTTHYASSSYIVEVDGSDTNVIKKLT
jgi:hypothetical protein